MPTIRAGDLIARLTVTAEELTDLPNGGQGVVDVAVLTDVPAQLAPIGIDEALRQSAQYATATHRARLRMPHDATGAVIVVTPAMLAAVTSGYTGRVQAFAIVGVTDLDGRGRELELVLEERVT